MVRLLRLVVAVACAIAVYLVVQHALPGALPFKPINAQEFVGLLAWFFALALFIERAVEVVVMVFRDEKAELINQQEAHAQAMLRDARAGETAALNAAPADPAAVAEAKRVVADASAELAKIQNEKIVYCSTTREVALLTGVFFGIAVSLAGVRILRAFIGDASQPGGLFDLADVVVTGAVLAGGSEGIHRIANAFTSFMDAISAKNAQAQKIAQGVP